VGVDPKHIRLLVPLRKNHENMVQVISEELSFEGVSVIIFRRECIQAMAKRKRMGKKLAPQN
ncbi:MAG: hypothetical protein L3J11_09475, partial [Draconibacterium sp.]|nr:hypothetical protein [Draconibacterium sp.]